MRNELIIILILSYAKTHFVESMKAFLTCNHLLSIMKHRARFQLDIMRKCIPNLQMIHRSLTKLQLFRLIASVSLLFCNI